MCVPSPPPPQKTQMEKTEKTMAELEIDMNVVYELSCTIHHTSPLPCTSCRFACSISYSQHTALPPPPFAPHPPPTHPHAPCPPTLPPTPPHTLATISLFAADPSAYSALQLLS
jgi:hypothetical protein